MAGIIGSVTSGAVALTGGAAQTVLQLIAPANQRLRVQQIEIEFDGTNSANTPASVQVLRQTGGTFTTSLTAKKVSESTATGETLQGSGKTAQTVAPTDGDILFDRYVPVFGGLVIVPETPGQELMVQGGTILGIKINAPQGVNAKATIKYEE